MCVISAYIDHACHDEPQIHSVHIVFLVAIQRTPSISFHCLEREPSPLATSILAITRLPGRGETSCKPCRPALSVTSSKVLNFWCYLRVADRPVEYSVYVEEGLGAECWPCWDFGMVGMGVLAWEHSIVSLRLSNSQQPIQPHWGYLKGLWVSAFNINYVQSMHEPHYPIANVSHSTFPFFFENQSLGLHTVHSGHDTSAEWRHALGLTADTIRRLWQLSFMEWPSNTLMTGQ